MDKKFIIKKVDNKFHVYHGDRLVTDLCLTLEAAEWVVEMEKIWLDMQSERNA